MLFAAAAAECLYCQSNVILQQTVLRCRSKVIQNNAETEHYMSWQALWQHSPEVPTSVICLGVEWKYAFGMGV